MKIDFDVTAENIVMSQYYLLFFERGIEHPIFSNITKYSTFVKLIELIS